MGRARICTHAVSPGPSGPGAASSARIGSGRRWSCPIGSSSPRASRSTPPATTSDGVAVCVVVAGVRAAGVVWVRAPGQAAVMARSTRPGGIRPGIHIRIWIPSAEVRYSNARWCWPCHSRVQRGRNSPIRCAHNATPPSGSTRGGGRIVISRARRCQRRSCRPAHHHRRPPAAAARTTTVAAAAGSSTCHHSSNQVAQARAHASRAWPARDHAIAERGHHTSPPGSGSSGGGWAVGGRPVGGSRGTQSGAVRTPAS